MKQRVFEQAEAANVRFVSLQFTDIMGVVKNVHIPFHKFGDAVEHGLWFDGSSIEGFARIHESDMFLDPDLETFGVIPWERRDDGSTAKVICDVYTPDGEPFAGDPRGVLRRQLKRAEDMGFRYMTGPELEFFMLRRSHADGDDGLPDVQALPHDQAGYFDLTTDEASNVR
ncbi:MAG: glutamine synthetase, partial [Sphingomonadales bacterium]|nr:glutamine synthetase [Sphingomonadales bacterium]